MLIGQRHDGHPTHRMPDEHQRAGGGDRRDHTGQVASKLVDVVRVEVGVLRPTVAALVVEDQAGVTAQGLPLVVPRIEIECIAVGEDDGQSVGGRHGVRCHVVDLHVQQDAVVSRNGSDVAVEPPVLRGPVRGSGARAEQRPFSHGPHRGACGQRAGGK